MFNIFKREKWALVNSIKFAGYRSFYIHLFESETGKRKAEYNYSGKNYNVNYLWTKDPQVQTCINCNYIVGCVGEEMSKSQDMTK